MTIDLTYEPDGEVLTRYLFSRAPVSLIQGPRGSGKSTGSVNKLWINALTQRPAPDGIRYRRSYVIRNTFDELKRTTVATWLMTFKESQFPGFKWSAPFEHRIRVAPSGGQPGLDWQVIFLALDREEDRKKLLSAEMSDAWLNEFRELQRGVIDDIGPTLRYPPETLGGSANRMIICDTNAPPESHWFAAMSGQVPMPEGLSEDQRRERIKPEPWAIFMQPGAMFEDVGAEGELDGYRINPKAENLKWLPPRYYEDMIIGKSRSWVRVNVLNLPGQETHGEPVWPDFRDELHCAPAALEPYPGIPILIGLDFGRTPAAVFAQRAFDRWVILGECIGKNIGAREFAKVVRRYFGERFPGFKYQMWGDPAGDHLAEADDISPFMMFRAEGWVIHAAPTNDPTVRIGAVEALLRDQIDGRQRFTVSSVGCPTLKAAMLGGYHYRRKKVPGEVYAEAPDKNWASHVADALQYVVIGAGEGRALLTNLSSPSSVVRAPLPAGVFARRSPVRASRAPLRGWRR